MGTGGGEYLGDRNGEGVHLRDPRRVELRQRQAGSLRQRVSVNEADLMRFKVPFQATSRAYARGNPGVPKGAQAEIPNEE